MSIYFHICFSLPYILGGTTIVSLIWYLSLKSETPEMYFTLSPLIPTSVRWFYLRVHSAHFLYSTCHDIPSSNPPHRNTVIAPSLYNLLTSTEWKGPILKGPWNSSGLNHP